MKLSDVLHAVIFPGLAMLPPKMNSPAAVAMLIAIGLQESRFIDRRQIGGPARGFYQFEAFGGVNGVLQHQSTKKIIADVLDRLQYDHQLVTSYAVIEHNDVLATVFARLLLWTVPKSLPKANECEKAWQLYLEAWRPGRPHRETWDEFYRMAWDSARISEDQNV